MTFCQVRLKKYSYENEVVLQSLSFDLSSKKTTALLGPSGCGKSTLLRVLMGFEKGAEGELIWDGESFGLKTWSEKQTRFGLVPQVPHLFPWKTIEENLQLAVAPSVTKIERDQKMEISLQSIGLSSQKNKYPHEISVGMASRVSFARTLLVGCDILLLDEPFAALDAHSRYQMQMWFLDHLKNQIEAAIFVTHDVREALILADEILVLGQKPATIQARYDVSNRPSELKEWVRSEEFFRIEKQILKELDTHSFSVNYKLS